MLDEKELELLSLGFNELIEELNEKRYVMTKSNNVYSSVDTLDKVALIKKIKQQDKVIKVSQDKLQKIRKKLKNADVTLTLKESFMAIAGLLPYLALFKSTSITVGIVGMTTTFLLSTPALCSMLISGVHEKNLSRLKERMQKEKLRKTKEINDANDNKKRLLSMLEYANYLEFLKDVKNMDGPERFSDSFEVINKDGKEKIISRID